MNRDIIEITRKELYEKVWTEPVMQLKEIWGEVSG